MSFNVSRLKNLMLLLFLTGVLAVCCLIPSIAHAVTDETGRRVQVRPAPQRIVSLAPGISETLYALGLEDKIVGVTTFCDWPPAVQAKTKIGGFTNPSIEKIVALRPDLILAAADGNRKETVRQLEKLGLPVYVTNPTSTSGVLKSIGHIGAITGREKEAAALVENSGRNYALLPSGHAAKRSRAFFSSWAWSP